MLFVKHAFHHVHMQSFSTQPLSAEVLSGTLPRCVCGGVIRPNVVFFGESLPSSYHEHIDCDAAQCDLLLIIGTSLAVTPAADLVGAVRANVPRVFVGKKAARREMYFNHYFLSFCSFVYLFVFILFILC